jgi:hypothetical protein
MAQASLGVHQQTVANRIRAVEETLGPPSLRGGRSWSSRCAFAAASRSRPPLQAGLQNEGYLP